jgi:hypothetical protein
VCEVYVEGSDPRSVVSLGEGNFTNLVDYTPSVAENVSDNTNPPPVAPGHRLIFYFTGATALDTLSVTVVGSRKSSRPHGIFRIPRTRES